MGFIFDAGDVPIIDVGFIESNRDLVVPESIDLAIGIKVAFDIFAILFRCFDKFLLFEESIGSDEFLSIKFTIRIISKL
jgi:hypothetical protein